MKTWNAGSEVLERRCRLSRHAPGTFQNGTFEIKASFRPHCSALLVRVIRDWSKPVSWSGPVNIFIEHGVSQC
jgi:hypothetical protein